MDPALTAALMGFIGVLVGGVIGGWFSLKAIRQQIESEYRLQQQNSQAQQRMEYQKYLRDLMLEYMTAYNSLTDTHATSNVRSELICYTRSDGTVRFKDSDGTETDEYQVVGNKIRSAQGKCAFILTASGNAKLMHQFNQFASRYNFDGEVKLNDLTMDLWHIMAIFGEILAEYEPGI